MAQYFSLNVGGRTGNVTTQNESTGADIEVVINNPANVRNQIALINALDYIQNFVIGSKKAW